jgi:hypothetical protein
MRGTILCAVLVAAMSGCFTTAEVGYSASYSSDGSYAANPDLVAVGPGVQVVADYDEPVFFVDGFYWRYYGNVWYRSNNYATGWYYYDRPPVAVLRIDRPYAYAHYRPAGYVARSRPRYRPPETIVRDHRQGPVRAEPVVRERPGTYAAPVNRNETMVRDHRAAPPPAAPPAAAPAPAPVVRDHRSAPPPAERKEETRDHRH